MFDENPSQFGKLLVNIKEVLNSSDEFKDVPIYFHERQVNSNTSLPCIILYTGNKTVVNGSPFCTEYSRDLEIRLCTKTLDKVLLFEELLKYEEDLIRVLNYAKLTNQIEGFEIDEDGTGKVGALMFNAPKEGNRTDMSFFSNVLRVFFKVKYSL